MDRAWIPHSRPSAPDSPGGGLGRKLGFVLAGIVVALVLIGQLIFLARIISSGSLTSSSTTVQVPKTGSLAHRLDAVLANALGPSDRGVRRFAITAVHPAGGHFSAVSMTWAINSDISAGTIGNGAQADVYLMLRDIYTSGLPVASVRLAGTYPLSNRRGKAQETVVMRLAMTRKEAATAAEGGWENLDAQTLWPLVDRIYVNPQVQPLPSG